MKFISNKIYLFLLIGVICIFNNCGCARSDFKYTQYSSKDPELNISIDYISSWLHREHKEAGKYAGVLFFEDRKDRSFKAKISVTVSNSLKSKNSSATIDEMVNELVNKRLKFKDAKLVSKDKTALFGIEAREILLSHKAMDKLYSTDAKLISVKERIIIFKRGYKVYLLRYENYADGFDKYDSAFKHIVRTLKINENN